MNPGHINATCAGIILGCVAGGVVAVLFPGGGLRSGIELTLMNGAVLGVVALVISIIKAWRSPR